MSIYVISDLHLSNNEDKPMDIFGDSWKDHVSRVKQDWEQKVKEEDVVILGGDTSWALKPEEAVADLSLLDTLPGKKVIIKGNHDLWWQSLRKNKALFPYLEFLQNDFYPYGEYAICGTRGWACPNEGYFTQQDQKIYLREIQRLELSLSKAKEGGYNKLIVVLHYPPTNEKFEPSGFTELIQAYGVEKVVYGHLHGEDSFPLGLQGKVEGVDYYLTSMDYLNCNLFKLL